MGSSSMTDASIEEALRSAIATFLAADDYDSLTLKRIRIAAEKKLGVPEDFFKKHETWKSRSKDYVLEEVACFVPP